MESTLKSAPKSNAADHHDADLLARAAKVKLILMDVDGVLTNGNLFYFPGPDGKPVEFKSFNSQDGAGIHCLNLVGINTGVISGRDSQAVVERARILNIKYVYQGFLEKEAVYEEILQKEGLTDESVCFIGDDFPDFILIKRCGLGVAVGNARPELIERAHYTTKAHGGDGAVREVAELVIRARGQWDTVLKKFGFVD